MKPTTINVQITKCPKQYEAVRLGMECSLEPGDTVESAIQAATSQLNALYEEMHTGGAKAPQVQPQAPAAEPKPEPAKREPLHFGDKRVQQIVTRMEKNPGKAAEIMQQTLKYFEPDEQVTNVLNLAAKLN